MTVRASLTQRPLVGIVLGMATVTIGTGLTIAFALYMALLAFNFSVFSSKCVVGCRVIKLLLVKNNNFGVNTLMLGMAGLASLRLHLAVITGMR